MNEPSLFPVATVPVPALSHLQLAATAARLARTEFSAAMSTALTTAWDPAAIEEVARLVKATKEIHEAAEALLTANRAS